MQCFNSTVHVVCVISTAIKCCTFCIYLQLLKENIYVTTVCPGPVRTEIFRSAFLKDGSLVRNTSEAEALVDVPQRFAISANRLGFVWLIHITYISTVCVCVCATTAGSSFCEHIWIEE